MASGRSGVGGWIGRCMDKSTVAKSGKRSLFVHTRSVLKRPARDVRCSVCWSSATDLGTDDYLLVACLALIVPVHSEVASTAFLDVVSCLSMCCVSCVIM